VERNLPLRAFMCGDGRGLVFWVAFAAAGLSMGMYPYNLVFLFVLAGFGIGRAVGFLASSPG